MAIIKYEIVITNLNIQICYFLALFIQYLKFNTYISSNNIMFPQPPMYTAALFITFSKRGVSRVINSQTSATINVPWFLRSSGETRKKGEKWGSEPEPQDKNDKLGGRWRLRLMDSCSKQTSGIRPQILQCRDIFCF